MSDNTDPNASRKTPERRGGHRRTFEIKATPQAAQEWDFVAHRPPGKKANVFESIGNLTKSCLGGGVVAIHESFKRCGLWTSVFLIIALGFSISYCMYTIARSAQKMYGRVQIASMSYPDLAEVSLATGPFEKLRKYGKCFRYAVDFTIMVDLFGACCVYQVVICRSIKQLIEGVEEVSNEGNPPLRVYILIIMIPCILICMITTLKYLAPFSIVADIFILILMFSNMYYATQAAPRSPFEYPAFKNVGGLLEFLGVGVFSMEGTGATLAIENNMKEPKKIGIVMAGGMSIVVGIVMCMGFFGYWGYDESAKSPITLNFPFTSFSVMLKGFLPIIMYATFALNFFLPFELVWHYIKQRYDPAKYWLWQRVYRAIFVVGLTIIAVAFPNVSSFIGLLGSFCISNNGFIFPAFIELCVDWEYPGLGYMKWRLIKCIMIVVLGICLCCLGTYHNGKELLRSAMQ